MPTRLLLFIAASFLMLFWAYSNHFDNGFHFDDNHAVEENSYIRSLANIPLFFKDAATFSNTPSHQSYRPLVTTSLAIDYALGGNALNPKAFHISTFIWFIIQGVLVYFLALFVFNKAQKHAYNQYLAWFAAAFYTLHTAIAETVNYVISRSDIYATLCVVAAFFVYFYLPKTRKYYLYLLPILVGSLAKPTTFMFAPMLWVYVYLFESDEETILKKGINATQKTLLPFVLVLVLYVFISKMEPSFVAGGTSKYLYIVTQPWVICYYLFTFFLPIHLSADTDWTLLSGMTDIRFLAGAMVVLGLVYAIFWASKTQKFKPISFGIAWFLLALLPTSLVPLSEVMNDHRLYFPYIGLAISAVWIAGIWLQKMQMTMTENTKKYVVVSGMLLLAAHSYGVHQRNKVWLNDETLWYDVTVKSPKNGRGLMNYGLVKMANGEYPAAETYYLKALEFSPNYSYLYVNLGILNAAQGKVKEAESFFKQGIAKGLDLANCYYFYGQFLSQQNRKTEAIYYLKETLKLAPADLKTRYLLIENYKSTGNSSEIIKICKETLDFLPDDVYIKNQLVAAENAPKNPENVIVVMQTPEDYLDLSLKYYQVKDFKNCIAFCEKALKLRPKYADAYNNICAAHNELGEWNKAIEAGKKAVALAPESELAKNNLAWALQQKGK